MPAAPRPGGSPAAWPELAGGEPGPLYGLFSEEDFLLAEASRAFLAAPALAENPGLNQERFHAEDDPPARVLESARTLPFLGRRRLVVLGGIEAYKAAQLNEFLAYLEDPCPATCLLFTGRKLDARSKFAKSLEKHGKVRSLAKPFPRELPGWLMERARARGKRLARAAAEKLAELSGLGLAALDSELEKLALFVGEGGEIGLATVEEVTGRGRLYSIFDFTDALTAGRLDRALSAWDQLHALGEPAVRVLAMVVRLLRQLLEARGVVTRGGGAGEVQRALRVPPAAAETLAARARRETSASLEGLLAQALAADVALKSAPGSERVRLERLVMAFCRPESAAGKKNATSPEGGSRGGAGRR